MTIDCVNVLVVLSFFQINGTINSKHYHWLTKQRIREEAEADRNSYVEMPSDMGANWWTYICHRLRTLEKGMDAYASDKYTRLALDKYIESNRVCDLVAGIVTNHKS